MGKIVTVMNFKGGVGKTTVTMNLGCDLAYTKNVLLIDLDPQFNLSQYLLNYNGYSELLKNNVPSIYELFEEGNPNIPRRNIDDYIVHVQRDRGGNLDLIYSQLQLYYTMKLARDTTQTLYNKLAPILDQYDVILLDCPPTMSIISDAAFYLSDYVLIPVMPEFLCTIGLPLLYQSIQEFNNLNNFNKVSILGAVINGIDGYAPESEMAIKDIKNMCNAYGINVFGTEIYYSRSYPKSARYGTTVRNTPYSRWDVIYNFEHFVNEFKNRAGV